MTKALLILRWSMAAALIAGFSNVAPAQQLSGQNPGRKKMVVKTNTSAPKTVVANNPKTVVSPNQGVAHAVLNPKLAAQKRSAVSTKPGSGARNCTPKNRVNPFSISRAEFNKLPKSRQEFVIQHSDKYTITD